MKYINLSLIAATAALILPSITFASINSDGMGGDLGAFITNALTFISGIVIPFILAIGFLFFVWGMFMYFIRGGHSDEAQETGRTYIVSSLIGFVIILSFWGVINLISTGIGLDTQDPVTVPTTNIAP